MSVSKSLILNIIFIVTIYLALLTNCSFDYGISDIEVNFPDYNKLQSNISFSTKDSISTYIEYWIKGDSIKLKSRSTIFSLEHNLNLIYLESDTTYEYWIKEGEKTLSETLSFKTLPFPSQLPKFDIVTKSENVFDGFILLRNILDPGCQLMINQNGEIVWYQQSDSALFRPFNLTGLESYIALYSKDKIVEMDFYGDTLLNLEYGTNGFDKYLHHEILKDEQNNIIALTNEYIVLDLTAVGGAKKDSVKGDGILVLDYNGNKVWSWSIFDTFDPIDDPNILEFKKDWGHANSLGIDTDGDYLISFRFFDQVWKIDKNSGNIIWKLGANGDFDLNSTMSFYQQHNAHIDTQGNLLIFDNGNRDRNFSRAVSFKVDDNRKLLDQILNVKLPQKMFSFKQGSVDLFNDSLLLFSSTTTRNIVIENLKGNVLWHATSDKAFYRAKYIPNN